ncbi:MAG: sensor domain-containing diguanylate cyclase, partial [Vicinamibacterales bacterium]
RKLSDLIDVDAMLILLTNAPAGRGPAPEMRRAPDFPVIGQPVEEGIVAAVARSRQPLWINDYLEFAHERGLDPPAEGDARMAVPRAVIAAPIVDDDAMLGMLTVQALHPGAYDKRHVGIVEDIALHLGIALRNRAAQRHERTASAGRSSTHRKTGTLAPTAPFATYPAMMAELERLLARCATRREPVSLLFVDLDNFKLVNDAYGHRLGDEVMAGLSEFLPGALPRRATIASYAGDTFVVILPRILIAKAVACAEKLRAALSEHAFTTSIGHTVLLAASIGVVGVEPDDDTFENAGEFLHAADRAMFAAKLAGRNRVVRWTPALADELNRQRGPGRG